MEHHLQITLCVNYFYVQGLCFLHTISRDIQFCTVHPVPNRSAPVMKKVLLSVLRQYSDRGFQVVTISADAEFSVLRDTVGPIRLDIVPTDQHVGEVERLIRTIKERLRSCVHGLPYRRLPRVMIVSMVIDVVRLLNMFPSITGVSSTLSPSTIVTGLPPLAGFL
jgi:hypothetical protein